MRDYLHREALIHIIVIVVIFIVATIIFSNLTP